ncbi:MAG TPA: cyclic nucleotide-binding domain-containing protein [Aggregatilineales bacterium]|nr:cyclic nucleotide-binding domain-containing protein [Aggregatilineales bacterium]
MNLFELLKGIELFSGLEDDQLRRLMAISQEATYNDGEVIFAQGDEGESLYIIREGQVEVSVEQNNRRRSQIYLGDGQIFGEMALIDFGRRSATVHAVRDKTVVDLIRRDDFFALCDSDKALGYVVMRNMAIDLSFKLRHRNLDPNTDVL